ncbi:MAG: outer membrane protein transport protein, partial [Bacteroidales bacterium]|nr:outer membrane protein transport protein [Bacteroidales bacterium]
AISLPAFAEGYQINSQSVRQWGMAHTGTALKLGAESMLFNPAGLAYMDSKFDISFGTIMIKSKVDFEQGDYTHQTNNPLSTPVYGHLGFKLGKNLALGVNVTNPAGNSLVWGDDWAGATLIQNVSLKAFCVQPTVSYKIGKVLSIGAGLMIDFGSFEQEKALIGKNQLEALSPLAEKLSAMIPALGALPGAIQSFHDQYPAEIALKGSSKVSYGFNVGALVNITPKLTFGVNYRSKVKLSVEGGESDVIYANEAAKNVVTTIANFSIPEQMAGMLDDATKQTVMGAIANMNKITKLDDANFNASMPIPSILSFGLTYQPTSAWTITGEAQITGWSAYKSLDINFSSLSSPEVSVKNYKNTVAVRVGAEYDICDFATVRAGVYMDTPPVQMDNYNPETPSANSYGVTAGASLNPVKFLSIDLAVGYLRGEKTTGSCNEGAFKADYTKSAIMPGIGVRFHF